MRHSCTVTRLVVAGTFGYVGASPAKSQTLSVAAAALLVASTYAWSRRSSRDGVACQLSFDPQARTHPYSLDTERHEEKEHHA